MTKKNQEQPQLTKAEERVMRALWQVDDAQVRDLIEMMPTPKPHANTVNTLLRILAEKGFVGIENSGPVNRFQALVSKEDYSSRRINDVLKSYFNGSFKEMMSFFVADKELDIRELEQALEAIKKSKS
jgi:predicted transcriptional regulator